jgi:hypothetical protein
MARAYVASVCWEPRVMDFEYFAVQRHRLGELTTGYVEDEALDLGVED